MERKRALIVEDQPLNAKLLVLLAERTGLDAESAGDGREALEAIWARRPDVILLDLLMPIMNGEELLRIMQADPDLRTIPVIIISTVEDVGEGPARDLPRLRKPFEPAEVMRMIRMAVASDAS